MTTYRARVWRMRWPSIFGVMSALLFSLSLSVAGSERAGALPLLDTTRCLVRVVLLAECQRAAVSPLHQSEATTSESPTEQQAPSAPPQSLDGTSGDATSSTAALVAPESLSFDAGRLQPIEFSANLVSWRQQVASSQGASVANIAPVSLSDAAALGLSETAEPLRPSEHGWLIWGVAWYWWAGLVTASMAGAWAVRHTILKRRLNVAGSS